MGKLKCILVLVFIILFPIIQFLIIFFAELSKYDVAFSTLIGFWICIIINFLIKKTNYAISISIVFTIIIVALFFKVFPQPCFGTNHKQIMLNVFYSLPLCLNIGVLFVFYRTMSFVNIENIRAPS